MLVLSVKKQTEDKAGHELVEIAAPGFSIPIEISFEQLDLELVELVGRPDVDCVVYDLPDGRNAGKRQQPARSTAVFPMTIATTPAGDAKELGATSGLFHHYPAPRRPYAGHDSDPRQSCIRAFKRRHVTPRRKL